MRVRARDLFNVSSSREGMRSPLLSWTLRAVDRATRFPRAHDADAAGSVLLQIRPARNVYNHVLYTHVYFFFCSFINGPLIESVRYILHRIQLHDRIYVCMIWVHMGYLRVACLCRSPRLSFCVSAFAPRENITERCSARGPFKCGVVYRRALRCYISRADLYYVISQR